MTIAVFCLFSGMKSVKSKYVLHYRALLSFPHVFSGNPGKIKRMDARLIHSGMTNCAKFTAFEKVHGNEIRTGPDKNFKPVRLL
jgi:hypothetical protein